MKYTILHICNSDSGGAGIAALRLHKALLSVGIKSRMLCLAKTSDEEYVEQFSSTLKNRILAKILYRLRIRNYKKFARHNHSNYEITTYPRSIYNVLSHPWVKDADIINLHWLGNFIDYPTFFSRINKPIVWTLHDMNPFLGISHYMGDFLSNKQNTKFEQNTLNLKLKAYRKADIHIVSLCNWMAQYVQKSNIFANRDQHIIPNSINTNIFKYRDSVLSKKILGIKTDNPILLFCSQSLTNKRKGFDLLLDALDFLSTEYTIVTIGSQNTAINPNIHHIPYGTVKDEFLLALLYSAADRFILSSREDNLPNTMVEALCCGTPVISFSNGGMRDYIQQGINGLIASNQDAKSLAEAIKQSFTIKYNRERISEEAVLKFNPHMQATAYASLYSKTLN